MKKNHRAVTLSVAFFLTIPLSGWAEVFVSGETEDGTKLTLYLDYNSYGAGDWYQGAVLTVEEPGKEAVEVVFDEPTGKESNVSGTGVHERAVDLVKVDGRWHLMVIFQAVWDAGTARLRVRYFAPNFDEEPAPEEAIDNGINSFEFSWEGKEIEGVSLRRLSARGVPGDEWDLETLE